MDNMIEIEVTRKSDGTVCWYFFELNADGSLGALHAYMDSRDAAWF